MIKTIHKTLIISSLLITGLSASSFIEIPQKACINGGGELKEGECITTWDNAVLICSSIDARLPTIDELQKAVTEWSKINIDVNNTKNITPQSYSKNNGFVYSHRYWSSTTNPSDTSVAQYIVAHNGNDLWRVKSAFHDVRCVQDNKEKGN